MIAGMDTHTDTLAVAVVDDTGRLVAGGDVPNTERGFAQLVDMFTSHHVQRVGIEGSGSFGRAVAVHLALCWQSDQAHPMEPSAGSAPVAPVARE